MSDSIISVENLGKCYRIRHQQARQPYVALRDVLAAKMQGVARRLWSVLHSSPLRIDRGENQGEASHPSTVEEFWALRDVSFEVKPGEVVGIIGRNGAGKSTLLKILSQITEPTEGRVRLRGRVASLLEVGTGFHPELTGRENIFLNGAILGMSRAEIRKKFDEIVAFAEVEKFLDTPVKRYSSGMYVRLAFAVAAHLESEILIVDEVLAVGDAEFQKKCLGKMNNVAQSKGRTVLFVSHNLDALQRVCRTGLLLTHGCCEYMGSLEGAFSKYLLTPSSKQANAKFRSQAPGIEDVRVSKSDLPFGRLRLEIDFSSSRPVDKPTFGIVVYTAQGTPVFGSNTLCQPCDSPIPSCSRGTATFIVDPLPLWSGNYSASVWLSDGLDQLDHCDHALTFEFVSPAVPPNLPPLHVIGPCRVPGTWTFAFPRAKEKL
jgi:lipopolysaccharide transport system ATP-binding protein